MSLFKYKYYDTPEGQDIYKKVFVTSKYAFVSGATLATFDVLMYSRPETVLKTGSRFFFYLGPMVGMAATFSFTTNYLQNARGKNDMWNYFVGGVTAGSIIGVWTRSGVAGVPAALACGVAAAIKKMGIDNGWTFFPDVPQWNKTATNANADYTLAQDVPKFKNWTTGAN